MKGTVSTRCVAEVRQGKLGRFISAEQTVREKDEMAGNVQKRPPEEQNSAGADWRPSLAPVWGIWKDPGF